MAIHYSEESTDHASMIDSLTVLALNFFDAQERYSWCHLLRSPTQKYKFIAGCFDRRGLRLPLLLQPVRLLRPHRGRGRHPPHGVHRQGQRKEREYQEQNEMLIKVILSEMAFCILISRPNVV